MDRFVYHTCARRECSQGEIDRAVEFHFFESESSSDSQGANMHSPPFAPRTFVAGKVNCVMLYDEGCDFCQYPGPCDVSYTDKQSSVNTPCTEVKVRPIIASDKTAKAVIIELKPPESCVGPPGCLGRLLSLFRLSRGTYSGSGNISGNMHGGGKGGGLNQKGIYQFELSDVQMVLSLD
jgi:hypothetical protein